MLGLLTFTMMALVQAQDSPTVQPDPAKGAWTISPQRSVFWAGVEHIPIGACLPGDLAKIKEAQAAGITDFVVEFTLDGPSWEPVIQALEAAGSRYFIRIATPSPSPKVWAVEPGAYRQQMSSKRSFDLEIPGAESALAALVNKRGGDVRWNQRVQAKSGRITFSADAYGLESVLLLYPNLKDASLPDFWDGWDQHRDSLLRSVSSAKFGRGFRGMIDPIGSVASFPSEQNSIVPSSEMFRLELEQLLQVRHGTIDKALDAWSLRASDIRSFKRLSRLIPLWSGRRGVSGLYDPVLDRVHIAESGRSTAWKDIRDAASETMHRRVNRLVTALQSLFDAPVIQTFTGWQGPWTRSSTALHGLCLQMDSASSSAAAAKTGRAAGALSSWIKPGMMTALVSLSPDPSQRQPVERTVQEGMSLGVSGWFFRPSKPEDLAEIATASRTAERLWAGYGASVRILPFPESARGAAQPQQLASSIWWAPGPGTGERLSLELGVEGYRYQSGSDRFVALWTNEPKMLRFRANDPKKLLFETLDGSPPNVRLKGKKELEITLGRLPILIRDPEEVPAPIESFALAGGRIKILMDNFDSQVDVGGQTSNVLADCLRGFDSQPGGSLVKALDLLRVVGPRVAPYSWTEAEQITEQTFSDTEDIAGASRGKVLSVTSRLGTQDFTLAYGTRIRKSGLHEIWVAGRLAPKQFAAMTLAIGGTEVPLDARLAQHFGGDLAWYRLGAIDLQTGVTQVKLNLKLPAGESALLDVLLLTPQPFTPNGPIPPMEWVSEIKTPGRGSDGPPLTPPKPSASPARLPNQVR